MRKTSKKALSLLLALVMLLTSLSVGFTAFAADDPYQTLAEALKSDGVQNASWPGSASLTGSDADKNAVFRVSVDDSTGDIRTAAEAFWKVVESVAPRHSESGHLDSYYTMLGVKQEIMETLQSSAYGFTPDQLAKANAALDAFSVYQEGDARGNEFTILEEGPNKRDYYFTVNSSVTDQILTYTDVDSIPDTLYAGVQYYYWHDAQNIVVDEGWIFDTKRRNLVLKSWTRTEINPDTTTVPALKDFAAYFTEDRLNTDLSEMDGDELKALLAEIDAKINANNLYNNTDVMDHFFGEGFQARVAAFRESVATQIDKAYAEGYALKIKDIIDANGDLTGMSRENLTALQTQVNAQITNLQGLTGAAQNYGLQQAGLTWDDVNAFVDSVEEEIEVRDLQAQKDAVDALVESLPADLSDQTAVPDETITAALATVKAAVSVIEASSQNAIDRVFGEAGTAYVTDLQQKLQVEADVRELDDKITDFGAYFYDKLLTDLTTLDTDTLLSWRTDDRAQFEAMQKYQPEAIDRVYGDGYFAKVEAYIASIDSTLQARAEAQIDEAVDNYQEYGKITILNYKEVAAAIGGVQTKIFAPEGPITLTEEYQQKYSQFSAMMDEYNAFVASNGASNWTATEVDYPTRETPMADDMARTENEAYEVTPEKLDEVIAALDGLMQNEDLSGMLGLDKAVSELIKGALSDNLYTDQMVNTLVTTVYGLISDLPSMIPEDMQGTIDTLLSVLQYDSLLDVIYTVGIAVTPAQVATFLDESLYPEAEAALIAAGDSWDNYDMTTTWKVTDKASFVQAVSYALCGIQDVLKVALTNRNWDAEITVLGIGKVRLNISAMNLYDDAIVPLLELLGCENLTSASTYNAYQYSQDLLQPILNPLLDWVENLADQPISYILDLLPKLAYAMEFDMIREKLENVTVAGTLKVVVDLGLFEIDAYDLDLGKSISDALGSNNLYGILTSQLKEINGTAVDWTMLSDINKLIDFVFDLVAPGEEFYLPEIDQAYLASLGDLNTGVASAGTRGTRNEFVTDRPAVLLSLLRYVLPLLANDSFMDGLFALIGKLTGSEIALGDDILGILQGLGENPDGVICALTELFVPYDDENGGYVSKELQYLKSDKVPVYNEDGTIATDEEGNEIWVNQLINEVTYSEDWTKDQAQFIADNLDDFINNMMIILGGADMPTLGEMIRSYIADDFYTNETINSIIALVMEQLDGIGIDLLPILQDLLGVDLSDWEAAAANPNYDWGVLPGDTETFKAGLKDALSPFAPIMATLMSGQKDLTILGTVTMKSYPGYRNGIAPLLEAIGCENVMPADEYEKLAADGTYDQMISAIIDPILDLVDRVYEAPVDTLLDILPNTLYFIQCGNLQTSVENALQSAFVLLDTIRPIYNLSFDLNLNLQQIVLDLLANLEVNGQKLNLKIPFLSDFTQLCVGTVAEYESASGKTAYKLVDVDRADFVTVLMRNIVDLIFYQDNINAIVDLVGSYANMSDENKATLAEILGTFAEMYKENNGVDKILNAVYVIYKGVYDAGEGAISGLGDLNDRWSAVFEMLYNSGNPVLEELAKTADELLDWLTFGFITGEGIGTAGLIDFFDRLSAFFTGRVTDVSISQTEADMYQGTKMTLSLSFKPVTVKNTNAAWTTSDPSIATVENGVVTAVGPGDAEITATTEDGGLVVSCVVRVRADKTALNEAIAFVESTELTEEQAAAIETTLNAAKYVQGRELARQEDVDSVTTALLDALKSLDLGGSIESVVITQNGEAVGQVVYQQVKWYNRWNSTPVELGIQINEGATVRSITWSYANWSVDDPEADIEAAEDGMTALIRAKNSVVGAHSCWIQVTVEDVYGNKVTSDPVKVRFYNYDWQK